MKYKYLNMKKKNKMWTTKMLLDCIVRSDIKTSWQIKDSEYQQTEHAKIVALLKAFGLYVEEKQPVFDKNKISDDYAFDISDFLNGNFIRKRSKKDITILLKELEESKIIRQPYQRQQKNIYFFLRQVFKYLIDYRITLHHNIETLSHHHISGTLILYHSLILMEQQAEIIDSALLKIIGYKTPVSEKVLIKKYGFPKDEILTEGKSLEEILAAL